MIRRTLALSLVLCVLGGCAYGTPPELKESVLPPAVLMGPLGNTPRGNLVMLRDGHWAAIADGERTESLVEVANAQPGDVIAAWAGERSQRPHLFVVALSRPWGLVLQRLDDGPINTLTTMQMAIVSPSDPLDAIGLCFGQGDPRTAPCIAEAPVNTRFDVYPASGLGSIAVREPDMERYTSFTTRAALTHTMASSVDALTTGAPLPSSWVAVRSSRRHAPWPRPRVAASASCALAADGLPMRRVDSEATLSASTSLFEVEGIAFDHAADAIVSCSERTFVAGPSISRHPLRALTGRLLGPSYMTSRTLEAGGRSDAGLARLALAYGMAARGDLSASAFLIESLLDEGGDQDALARAGVDVLATAGMPSLAMRAAYMSRDTAWNPREDLGLALGLTAIYGALGYERELLGAQKTAASLAQRTSSRDSEWFRWRTYVVALEDGSLDDLGAIERIEKSFPTTDDDVTWWLAIHAARLMRGPLLGQTRERSELLAKRARERSGGALWDALRGESLRLTCESERECELDAYGRFSWNAVDLDALLRARPAQWSPGYQGHPPRPTPVGALAWIASTTLDALAEPNLSRDALIQHAVELGAGADATWCEHQREAASASGAFLALPSPRRAASWLLGDAFDTVCADPSTRAARLMDALTRERRPASWKETLTGALLRGSLSDPRALPDAPTLERALAFARERNLPNACAEWASVLSLGHLTRGRIGSAGEFANVARLCEPTSEDARTSADLAYALSHRARFGAWPDSSPPALLARLEESEAKARASRIPSCPGLALATDTQALGAFPALAGRLDALGIPPEDTEAIRLTSREDHVLAARDRTRDAHAALAAGDLAKSRAELSGALERAERSGVVPVIRLTRALGEWLFPEGLDAKVALVEPEKESALARARANPVEYERELTTLPERDEAARRALLMLRALADPEDAVDAMTALGWFPDDLCSP